MEAAEIAIVDVDAERARALAERMRLLSDSSIDCATDIETSLAMADGIVNTTPVGMTKYPGLPFAVELLQPRHWVAEVVYFPAETELLRRARAPGGHTLAGSGKAMAQAARAFELVTGRAAEERKRVGE